MIFCVRNCAPNRLAWRGDCLRVRAGFVKKYANFETMDTAKIENIFKEWQSKSYLTWTGAYKCRLRSGGSGSALFLSTTILVIIFVYFFIDLFPRESSVFVLTIVGVVWVLSIVLGLSILWPTLYFYKDRMVESKFFGLFKKSYQYTDLEEITCKQITYKNKSGSVDHFMSLNIKVGEKTFVIDGDSVMKSQFGRLSRFFTSCFKPIFVNQVFFEYMVDLFANIVVLKKRVARTAALKYFSESKYSHLDYEKQLDLHVNYLMCCGKDNYDYDHYCYYILRTPGVDYADRLDLLAHLFECAYASDNMVDNVELKRLSRIAYWLCIKDWDFLSLKYHFEAEKQAEAEQKKTEDAQQRERYQTVCSNRMREAYKMLGLREKASLEEVKSAYRKLVKVCHPDTLPPTAQDSEREEASIRFRMSTEAYDFLCAELCAEPVSVAR